VIAKHSELDEVWRENEDEYPDWRAGVDDLKARLTVGWHRGAGEGPRAV